MLLEDKVRLEGLREKLIELEPYRLEIEKINNEIQKIYSSCEHPFAFEGEYDHDYHEGRTYVTVRCPDCLDFWEDRDKNILETLFEKDDFEHTNGNLITKKMSLKNTEEVRSKISKRMKEMDKKGKRNAYKVLLEKYKELVNDIE